MINEQILIVEDEAKLAQLLVDYLEQSQFSTHCIYDGHGVINWVRKHSPAAILLDVMLPGKNGMDLCKEIRQFSTVPILMITARVDEIDRLLGLELGADDYICKPFSPREVVARIKAVLRRSVTAAPQTNPYYLLDQQRLLLSYQQQEVALTAVEFKLLKQLSSEPGRIFSRNQLMDQMYSDHRVVSDRTIDSHIKKLRKKLSEQFPGQEFIQAVYGAGYKFSLPDSTQ